ncbi:lipopolysaccharide-induced tumor necrosis factor-alpha factor homolog [Clarias gariepinus]|uniref:lipopolysaccharide-induced tumor necrosis factor-alpha factor homolog n=1 Tax=Clarias gariepinus TaxID=13013 RepID=UPI00234C3D5A|nr:lipopolysaccharide-induced tumor necrosis factor-alpha factor homolog [Clarias gariepinus]
MAFVSMPAPSPVYTEHTPAPAMFQAPPQPVYSNTQAPVIPQGVPVVIPAQPPVAVFQAPGAVVIQPSMSSFPAPMSCGFCQRQIVTMTKPINGLLTWLISGVLFFLCLWPCCLIPFFVEACKDVEHSCPNCRNVIHIYQRM